MRSVCGCQRRFRNRVEADREFDLIRASIFLMAFHEERRRVGVRLSVLQYLTIVLFSVLAVSFWVLQVVQHDKFQEMADNNHQRTLPLRAPRGVLFDRDGRVLVENRHSYSISIVREQTKDINRTIAMLASVLGLEEALGPRHRRTSPARAVLSPDHHRAGCVAGAGRCRHGAPPRQRTAGRGGAAGADAPVSGNARRPSLRLRRRSQRHAGRRSGRPQERRHRRAVGRREDLQRHADGRGRRQTRGREQHRARSADARGGAAD